MALQMLKILYKMNQVSTAVNSVCSFAAAADGWKQLPPNKGNKCSQLCSLCLIRPLSYPFRFLYLAVAVNLYLPLLRLLNLYLASPRLL